MMTSIISKGIRKNSLWRNGVMANRFGVKGSYGEFKKHVPLYVKNTLARARQLSTQSQDEREQTKR